MKTHYRVHVPVSSPSSTKKSPPSTSKPSKSVPLKKGKYCSSKPKPRQGPQPKAGYPRASIGTGKPTNSNLKLFWVVVKSATLKMQMSSCPVVLLIGDTETSKTTITKACLSLTGNFAWPLVWLGLELCSFCIYYLHVGSNGFGNWRNNWWKA